MKIALIMENSQADKNEIVFNTLKSVIEPLGHEVFNYGMYGSEDPATLTYIQNGILAAILLNSKAADFVAPAKAPCWPVIPSLASSVAMSKIQRTPSCLGRSITAMQSLCTLPRISGRTRHSDQAQ